MQFNTITALITDSSFWQHDIFVWIIVVALAVLAYVALRRMKTIHKLVLKSYLGPMVLTFCIVTFVLMMNFVWRYIDELVGKGLDTMVIIELIGYATINMIPIGLPLAMLFAAIMTMGNLGENYELLAMKSSGMSLMKIMRPLIVVAVVISIGSFFVVNDLVPYANKKMTTIIFDIRKQKQVLEFKDGLFFNGMENMAIRVEHQDPKTGLLHDVLIYDNSDLSGNATTTTADSGYIRLSDDKRFLLVTLYNGHNYQHTRNSNWFSKNALRHDRFDVQEARIEMEGFSYEKSDTSAMGYNSQTKNLKELQVDIDSIAQLVSEASTKSYGPLLQDNIFINDIQVLNLPDSLRQSKDGYGEALMLDSIPSLDLRSRKSIYEAAQSMAINSRSALSFDESAAKNALNQLYRCKNDWHRKLALPVSVLIFFLIGAPLGAIIRKGGLGTPIVISVCFFVVYYVISLSGEKMAKEGTWDSWSGMWISTFILSPIAVYLIIKATNDSSLLDVEWYYARYQTLKSKTAFLWKPIVKLIPRRKKDEKVKK
jgi:lipopolysaccharide export system permease protein